MSFSIKLFILCLLVLTSCAPTSEKEDTRIQVKGDNEYCSSERPHQITPLEKGDISNNGFNNWVKLNTPDSIFSSIDSSYFSFSEGKYSGRFPLCFPYYLDYHPILGYFNLKTGECKFSSLPELDSIYNYDEVFEIAISNQYIFIVTYDDDLSFMSPQKEGIQYHIADIYFKESIQYNSKEAFDKVKDSIAPDCNLLSCEAFISWYKNYQVDGFNQSTR